VSDAATANIVTVQGVNASYAPKSGSEKIIRTNSLMLEDVALDVVSEAEVFFNIVEAMPTFPGGEDALQRFVRQHFIYPDFLKMSGLNGEVRLHFFVEADGSLSGLKVVQALHPEIDKAVMDALRQSSGQWQPGRQGSKAVRAAYTFVFRLLR
jgi:protein TonB